MPRTLASPPANDALPSDAGGRVLAAATRLLSEGGRDALTTRAITAMAGVQQPTLYRLFGDKRGLLDAVAEQALAAYVAEKQELAPNPDPLAEFRAGWDRHVGFGMANPALFAIIWGDPNPTRVSPAAKAGQIALQHKVRALAAAGLLRVSEERATRLTHASCIGAVLSLLDTPECDRDMSLATDAREAVIRTITDTESPGIASGLVSSAIALGACVDQADVLTTSERTLLAEWLRRITSASVHES